MHCYCQFFFCDKVSCSLHLAILVLGLLYCQIRLITASLITLNSKQIWISVVFTCDLNFREGVQVNGFGVFLFFIYPGAFVDLNSDDLSRSNPLKQLRIYCAGVWHNFILCIISCIFIFFLPWFLFPFYSTNGAIVTFQLKVGCLWNILYQLFVILIYIFRTKNDKILYLNNGLILMLIYI